MRSVCGVPTTAERSAKKTKLTSQIAGSVTSASASSAGSPKSRPGRVNVSAMRRASYGRAAPAQPDPDAA